MSPRIGHSRAGGTFGSGQALDSRLRGNDVSGRLYFYGPLAKMPIDLEGLVSISWQQLELLIGPL